MKTQISVLLIAIILLACGGGGSQSSGNPLDSTNVQGDSGNTGQFKDSNVFGLEYSSGSKSGVTNNRGEFKYETGRSVTFSVGGVTLGSTTGKRIVTPVDLVTGATTRTTAVVNMVRFLALLDKDENPENGITITPQIRKIAENWDDLDFVSSSFKSKLVLIASDIASIQGGERSTLSTTEARHHLEATIRCTYAGGYRGTYSGTDRGTFGFLVGAKRGQVDGLAYSEGLQDYVLLNGRTPISLNNTSSFVTGDTSTGAQFTGRFPSINTVSGTWRADTESGRFSGSRIGGSLDAVYRYTGGFRGDDAGLFTFDIDSKNRITGVSYSAEADELFSLSGSLSGNRLTVTTSSGATASGVLSKVSGNISGTWNDKRLGLTGTFSGDGCRLN